MDQPETARILQRAHRIAVVGWSPDPERPSNSVARYLADQGYEVLPVNPNYVGERAHGHDVVASITELDDVDIVDVFRRSEAVPDHVEEALELGAPVFWMQLGVRDEEAAEQLREAGITVVQDRCTAIEHRKMTDG